MSFYRIYRPQTIEEIDNVAVRDQLLSLLTKNKKHLPHAFLFTGPRGAGKTTAARIIAKLFNCVKPKKDGPCGKCIQCTSIADGRNLDVLEIDAASNRGIDEIRTLRDAINLTPSAAEFKVYIIDEVHMLTPEAFNALLKTLEEPPAHAVFVLATTDPQKVPATIKSRCVTVSFHRATVKELVSALKRIVKAEKIPIDDEALAILADAVDGSFRDAVKLLEQVSFHKGKVKSETVVSMLSLSSQNVVDDFVTSFLARKQKDTLAEVERCVAGGVNIREFLASGLRVCERQLIEAVEGKTGKQADIIEAIRALTEAYELTKISPVSHLPLLVAVIEFCREEEKPVSEPLGLISQEKLTEHWQDFIAQLKPYNHSIAAVLRSARPKEVSRGIVTIEAFYPFHKDKLSEPKTREMVAKVLKQLFGETVKVEVVLGRR